MSTKITQSSPSLKQTEQGNSVKKVEQVNPDKVAPNKTLSTHLIAGGAAGLMEALCCHPLDTIKVRMQLRRSAVSYTTFN
jgi:hypothetical protein